MGPYKIVEYFGFSVWVAGHIYYYFNMSEILSGAAESSKQHEPHSHIFAGVCWFELSAVAKPSDNDFRHYF